MMVYLGLFAPVLERLAVVAVKVAVDSMAATWPALYMLIPSDSFSNVLLQVICLFTILTSIFCYTTIGSKILKLSSQFGLLLVKQLTICLLYPHCFHFNPHQMLGCLYQIVFGDQSKKVTEKAQEKPHTIIYELALKISPT
ncbi:hypothetical protein DSO57_1039494 [Entomophthora muscae]|uniref:Uncharacterized protein n=1 Tax=Entomophthora muscae TaxID=34485 RepID=A0ACC2RD52_9FUNG|nr:hypothetical protein DSO57_1039494 [Entomophthora muscae]